jgi:hypothetical protein
MHLSASVQKYARRGEHGFSEEFATASARYFRVAKLTNHWLRVHRDKDGSGKARPEGSAGEGAGGGRIGPVILFLRFFGGATDPSLGRIKGRPRPVIKNLHGCRLWSGVFFGATHTACGLGSLTCFLQTCNILFRGLLHAPLTRQSTLA